MFFYTYNALTPEQIAEKLGDRPLASSVSPTFDELAGKDLKVILDSGTTLELKFESADSVLVSENGADAVNTAYKAMKQKEVVIVSFMLPGTFRGWNIMIETGVRKVTAFEVWFCGYKDNREVQREIHYGYAECGCGTGDPGSRHHITNRLECKGLYWKDDLGIEMLNFFPSVMYSTFVEISNPRGGITVSAPSDFIKITDNLFIYSRVECEYSGTLVLEVIDLFRVSAVGVRLGFDENDALEYRMYKAEGTVTGQGATYEPMTDYGTEIHLGPIGQNKEKGARAVYRPKYMHPDMNWEETKKMAEETKSTFGADSIMPGGNNMPLSDYMVGKQFTLRFDDGGPVWEYDVTSISSLRWRCEGESAWHEEQYEAFEPAENLIFFSHYHTGDPRYRCVANAVDFRNGLVTCIDGVLGNGRTEWEVGHKALFGIVEAEGVTAPLVRRHEITKELTGKSFSWTYSDTMTSIHVYSSPESYSWTIFLPNGSGGMMWSSPCIYVKLRDDAYLMSWVEETCNGMQGTFVFNPNIMHDAGFFYGIGDGGLKLTSFGAYARHCGDFDILKYFDQKNR